MNTKKADIILVAIIVLVTTACGAQSGAVADAGTEAGADSLPDLGADSVPELAADIPADSTLSDSAAFDSTSPGFSWTQEPIEGPGLRYLSFHSELLDTLVGAHVLVPLDYEERVEERYAVLYWLHGSGGGREGVQPLSTMFLEAAQQGLVAPFFVVFLESPPLSLWVDACEGAPVESLVVQELVPFIDATFRTRAEASGRWLEGFSMGGFGALRFAFLHADTFAHVSSLAAGPLSPDLSETPRVDEVGVAALLDDLFCGDLRRYTDAHPWTLAEGIGEGFGERVALRLAIGDRDNSHPNKVRFHERLVELGVPHAFHLTPGVGHRTLPLLESLGSDRWVFYPQP